MILIPVCFYTDAVKIINYKIILRKKDSVLFWKDNFLKFKWVLWFLFSYVMKPRTHVLPMLLTSVCFGIEFCLYRHMFIFLAVFDGFVITWSLMIILVVSDRLHLTFICFSQPSSVIQLIFLFCSVHTWGYSVLPFV